MAFLASQLFDIVKAIINDLNSNTITLMSVGLGSRLGCIYI